MDFQSSSFLGKLVFFRSLLVAKLPMDDVDFLVATVQLDLRQQAKYEARKTVNLNGLLSKPYASGVTWSCKLFTIYLLSVRGFSDMLDNMKLQFFFVPQVFNAKVYILGKLTFAKFREESNIIPVCWVPSEIILLPNHPDPDSRWLPSVKVG